MIMLNDNTRMQDHILRNGPKVCSCTFTFLIIVTDLNFELTLVT